MWLLTNVTHDDCKISMTLITVLQSGTINNCLNRVKSVVNGSVMVTISTMQKTRPELQNLIKKKIECKTRNITEIAKFGCS